MAPERYCAHAGFKHNLPEEKKIEGVRFPIPANQRAAQLDIKAAACRGRAQRWAGHVCSQSADMVTCSSRQTEEPVCPSKRKREEVTPQGRGGDDGVLCTSAGSCRDIKKAKYLRHRKQSLQLKSCDSGVCDLYDTPSPTPTSVTRRPVTPSSDLCPKISDRLSLKNFRDYGEECYHFKKGLEKKYLSAQCMANQPQLKPESRCKLISWLIPVHRHFSLGFESLCLTVSILDRFLSNTPVAIDCFQLVGVTSLLIACKQVETRPPRVKQLLALCCNNFTREQLCNLECIILLKLQFQLAAPTINFFLQHFSLKQLTEGEPSELDFCQASKALALAKGIAELSLADYAFSAYPPSMMAACCLALAKNILCQDGSTSRQDSGYADSELQECTTKIDLLVSLNKDSLQRLLPSDMPEVAMDVDN
ncbi:cyclin-O [Leptodactylus fuscus]|uniref:cyclin-O n=1 Tax=Leptodactylus fuscus TaxID=238119 RepID=UPI003F4ECF52